ncbi:MAG: metallophosphoesterase family protein [Chthoniobacterales bacterium]
MGKNQRVLVIADTHDHLPPRLEELAEGMDEIWHLGDVCAPNLLAKIRAVCPPLTLVRGNCDSTASWPLVVDLERNGVRFRLVHIPPTRAPENIDVVLHGHTHVPRDEMRGGVRFLNPGCVTRPNRGAPASAAQLEIKADGKLSWRLVPLRENSRATPRAGY